MENHLNEEIESLLDAAELLLEEDLEDPQYESMARTVVRKLMAAGHPMFDPDEDDGCITCLHMALMSALDGFETGYFYDDEMDDEDEESLLN